MERNVLLIVLDSARKDYYDVVSKTRGVADIRYENARSVSCWSVPSHPSIFTGKLPSEHGKHAHNIDLDLREFETICETWEGYTIGVSSNVYASSSYGFDKIFDEFIDIPRYQPFINGLNATEYLHTTDKSGVSLYYGFLKEALRSESLMKSVFNGIAAQTKRSLMSKRIPDPIDDGAKTALAQLKRTIQSKDEPVFGFANLMESHEPYSFFRGMDKNLVDDIGWSSIGNSRWDLIYDSVGHEREIKLTRQYHRASIEYVTRLISNLSEDLPDTTIIVTSDHGENLGHDAEDGLWAHTSSLSEALCHVPLDILNFPIVNGQQTQDKLVSHLDMPKIIKYLSNGEVPTIERTAAPAETLGMAAGPIPPKDEEKWDLTRRAAWRDTGEVVRWDVTDEEPEPWAASLFPTSTKAAHEMARRNNKTREIDAATVQHLETLGYK